MGHSEISNLQPTLFIPLKLVGSSDTSLIVMLYIQVVLFLSFQWKGSLCWLLEEGGGSMRFVTH